MHVIPFTGILGNHQTMTFVHAIALYQPTGIGSIKSRSYIIIDITGRYLIINYQRLVTEKRSYRHPHIFLFSRRFGGIGIKQLQHSSKLSFLIFFTMFLGISYHTGKDSRIQFTGMCIAKTHCHTIRKQILRVGGHRFFYDRNLLGQVHTQITVKDSDHIRIIPDNYLTITRTFSPNTGFSIITIISKLFQ